MAMLPMAKQGIDIDLLWTNNSPSEAFASQTIPLDLSKYEQIIIQGAATTTYAQNYANGSANVPSVVGAVFFANIGITNVSVMFGASLGGSGATSWFRTITTSSTGVSFGSGQRALGANTSATTNNTFAIPLKIWGVKKGLDYYCNNLT